MRNINDHFEIVQTKLRVFDIWQISDNMEYVNLSDLINNFLDVNDLGLSIRVNIILNNVDVFVRNKIILLNSIQPFPIYVNIHASYIGKLYIPLGIRKDYYLRRYNIKHLGKMYVKNLHDDEYKNIISDIEYSSKEKYIEYTNALTL